MKTEAKTVGAYELLDHGIDHAQYFPGCGVAYTDFANVVTGCGDNFAEALDDALELIAQDGYDANALELRIAIDEGYQPDGTEEFVKIDWPTEPSVSNLPDAGDDDDDERDGGSELYYYVSIRWN